jgi:hypothetical protein
MHQGATLVFYVVMAAASLWLLIRKSNSGAVAIWHTLRQDDATDWRRALVLVQFALSCLVLLTLFKVGSSTNVLLQLCGAGCVVTAMTAAAIVPDVRYCWAVPVVLVPMIWAVTMQPVSTWGSSLSPAWVAQDAALVRQIQDAGRPVASENMVLLMRAGVGVVFEPAIVTELAHVGRWDEAPLVAMVRAHGFAFMLTTDGGSDPAGRRTPAMHAAMLEAYAKVRQLRPGLWLRE